MTDRTSGRVRLPVLPLRETVMFPGVTAPIGAGRPATLRAIEASLKGEAKLIFAVAQRENVDNAQPEVLYTTGTVARVGQVQRGLGGIQLLLHGEYRAAVLQYSENAGHLEAVVQEAPDLLPLDSDDAAFVALYKEVRERASDLALKMGLPQEVVEQVLEGVEDPGRFADLVAGYIDITPGERQALLETRGVEERLRRVLIHVQRQLELVEAQEEIKTKVQEEIGERQREMFLREQLKAIQKELGDDGSQEVEELRERVEKLALPDSVREEVERELRRLERAGRDSMESQIIRTYLETIVELPWSVRSEDHLDLIEAATILDEDHYGLKDVKDRVLEFLAVRQLLKVRAPDERVTGQVGNEDDRGTKGQILLFIGPPGVGKTSIAKSIARAMGRRYIRISLGGARDEADIRGHRRTYVGAMPGRIIEGMKRAGTKNPVFLLDEVDKLGVSFQGDPASALLEVLDPAQNDSFTDHYLGLPFDLSEVLFIATANFRQNIPAPLLDRMETVEFSGYTEDDKLIIARQYLIPRQLGESGLSEVELKLGDSAIRTLIQGYTREAGVRQLEREIKKIARKVARKIATHELEKVAIEGDDVDELIGRPTVHPERAAGEDQVGIATGMYYTPAGGDIMFVEVSVMPGRENLVLTGQLGDVMKESAQAALTYAKTNARALGIDPKAITDKDVHIHVPAGSIPKDGPSAGVTMATALISALSGIPVRHDLAMTGEITLSGRVLPIGGVKEKVLGACRAGITSVILPGENLADLEDLSEDERRRIHVEPVDDLRAVLKIALRRPDAVEHEAQRDETELAPSAP
ncbi:MAG: endopeptidase La [Gemmatimonadota bacterium]|nr:endopeptidase La [Gemmatimonadota bacterium]MDH3367206.1 endopeptidase La [Gemmatimonadota bacterium]MDH3476906.1 endopeptidase La [Gemmatimonadota bacterium]MDH3568589.1 endopeptidase La [Gemmatimonadota bacterium]MDH5548290.1 endopeptidase La [Gemmatimonadota bacterium]